MTSGAQKPLKPAQTVGLTLEQNSQLEGDQVDTRVYIATFLPSNVNLGVNLTHPNTQKCTHQGLDLSTF
jgi:hypothetical protein